jgi:hypothetical protein
MSNPIATPEELMEDQEETIAKLRDGWGASRRRRKSKPSATGRSEAHTQAWRSRRSRWGGSAAVQKMTCVHSLTRIAHSLTLATIAAFRARAIIMRSTPQALVLLICSLPFHAPAGATTYTYLGNPLDDGAIIQWPAVVTLWLWISFAQRPRRPDPAWRALRGATLRRGIYPYPGGFDAS